MCVKPIFIIYYAYAALSTKNAYAHAYAHTHAQTHMHRYTHSHT